MFQLRSRHSINLPIEFIRDGSFLFKINEELIVRIDGNKIIKEKFIENK